MKLGLIPSGDCSLCIRQAFSANSLLRVLTLQVLVDVLYPIYLRPLKDGSVQEGNSSKLHFAFQTSLLAAKAAFDSGAGWRGMLDTLASQGCQ